MLLIMSDVVDAMLAGSVAAVLPFMILMMTIHAYPIYWVLRPNASSVSKSDTNLQYQRRVEKQQ
jgi:hypothetical protein